MKKYAAYKEIDLPWLSCIPSSWDIVRNKNIFTEVKEEVGDSSSDYTLLSLSINGVIPRDVESGKGKFPSSFDKYKVIKPGYMVFCLFDIDETPRTVGYSEIDGMITGAYTVFDVNNIYPRYACYYYLALDNVKALKPLYTGLRKTIKTDVFLSAKMPLPPQEEQEKIARYLDWQVSRVNKLIAAKKKQISLLEEQKKTVINKVVCQGVANSTPLKDSGVFWMGNIPEGWSAIKIKWLFNEDNCRNVEGDSELLMFSRRRGLIRFSDTTDKAPSASDLTKYRVVKPGQLLENRMQAWNGMFICVDKDGCVSPDYSVFNPSSDRYVNVKFYEYVFRSSLQVEQFANASKGLGTGFNRLYTPAFGAIYTVYPPREEQDAIVEYLDKACAALDSAIEKKEAQIATLQELKTLIISDAVMGKYDVQEIIVPEFEYVGDNEDDFDETDDYYDEGDEDEEV